MWRISDMWRILDFLLYCRVKNMKFVAVCEIHHSIWGKPLPISLNFGKILDIFMIPLTILDLMQNWQKLWHFSSTLKRCPQSGDFHKLCWIFIFLNVSKAGLLTQTARIIGGGGGGGGGAKKCIYQEESDKHRKTLLKIRNNYKLSQ